MCMYFHIQGHLFPWRVRVFLKASITTSWPNACASLYKCMCSFRISVCTPLYMCMYFFVCVHVFLCVCACTPCVCACDFWCKHADFWVCEHCLRCARASVFGRRRVPFGSWAHVLCSVKTSSSCPICTHFFFGSGPAYFGKHVLSHVFVRSFCLWKMLFSLCHIIFT